MEKLIFATNNPHKLRELREILADKFEILSLEEINCTDDIPETGETIEENASQKSYWIWNKYQLNCFSDDTGLEIESLNGEPGVHSARYAGEGRSSEDNVKKVLQLLESQTHRKARFKTVISLILHNREYFFEGIVKGEILTETRGNTGFGYDPIFVPEGYTQTFAEMNSSLKNGISHRGLAVQKLVAFLKDI